MISTRTNSVKRYFYLQNQKGKGSRDVQRTFNNLKRQIIGLKSKLLVAQVWYFLWLKVGIPGIRPDQLKINIVVFYNHKNTFTDGESTWKFYFSWTTFCNFFYSLKVKKTSECAPSMAVVNFRMAKVSGRTVQVPTPSLETRSISQLLKIDDIFCADRRVTVEIITRCTLIIA